MKHQDDMCYFCPTCGHMDSRYPEPKHTCVTGMQRVYDSAFSKASVENGGDVPDLRLYPEYQAMAAVYERYVNDLNGPGTPIYRLSGLLDQLRERFPDAISPFSSASHEAAYLREIDKLLATVKDEVVKDKDE